MFPFIEIFGKQISTYSICALLGLFAVMYCVSKLARSRGMEIEDPLISILVLIVPVALCGSLLFGLTNLDYFARIAENWDRYETLGQQIVAVLMGFGGEVFYGGFLGALLGMLVYCKVTKRPLGFHFDMLAVVTPLFHAFGRVGCFLSGCCFGVESPFGVVYTHATVELANGVCRFPVQLLEAALNVGIFLVLLWLFRRNTQRARHASWMGDHSSEQGDKVGTLGVRWALSPEPIFGNGRLMFAYFLLYGTVRFLDEFLRGDVYRGFLGLLSTSQWISLALIAIVLVWLVVSNRSFFELSLRSR